MTNARDKANIPVLNFQSKGIDDNADATAITIDSSERIGIGNTTPSNYYSNKLVIDCGSASQDGLTIVSESTKDGMVSFADGTSGSNRYSGFILYDHADNEFRIATNGSEKMRILSTGSVGINATDPKEKLDSRGSAVFSGDHATATNAYGTAHGILLSSTSNLGKITAISNGSNDVKLELRGLDGGSANANQLVLDGGTSNVGIGTSSPAATLHVDASGGANVQISRTSQGALYLESDGTNGNIRSTSSSGSLAFQTNGNNERMRITSGGTVFVSNTSEPSSGDNGAQISNGSYHIFCRNTSGASVFRTFGSSGEFRTLGSGNAQNTNNSYGAISDRVLKENEVDASSQWNDIKALQIKHYNFKSKPNEKQLGVIAQDLEASGMNGLVENNQDELYTEDDVLPEGKNIGDVKLKNYKSVKYSILYMKSVKALQEAMERIETLEAKVTELENA